MFFHDKMYYSSICFLIPILFLDVPYSIFTSLLCLGIFSFIYHNYPSKMTLILDKSNIINTCSIIYFNNFSISLYYIVIYLIEQKLWKTEFVVFFVYFLSYSKFMKNPIVNVYFFLSLFIYCITYLQEKNQFNFYPYQRWLWHFGQAMYIYHSISENYSQRLEF